MRIKLTIPSQLASSLREEVKKTSRVWTDNIYRMERGMAGSREQNQGRLAPPASRPWGLTYAVSCELPCHRACTTYATQDCSLDGATKIKCVAKCITIVERSAQIFSRGSWVLGGWTHSTDTEVWKVQPANAENALACPLACHGYPALDDWATALFEDPTSPLWPYRTVAAQISDRTLDIRTARS